MDYILQAKPYKIAMTDLNVGQHMREAMPDLHGSVPDFWVSVTRPWILRDVGQKVLIDPPHMKENKNVEFKFQVAFDEDGICEGEPLILVVRTCLNWVFGIVSDLTNFMP